MIDVEYTPSGTGAAAVDLSDFLDQLNTDLGYATLQEALTAAAGKTMLLCRDWTMGAAASVPAGTHVLGFGGSITANAVSFNALEIGGDGVTIEGVELVGPQSSSQASNDVVGAGIHAPGRKNLTVERCAIHGFSNCGVLVRGCFDVRIEGNRFYDNRYNSPYSFSDVSDICLYSATAGGRIIIANNLCLSNNSQGIYCNALGADNDVSVVGNICVATDGAGAEIATAELRRRHGIMVSYVGSVGSGRVAVVGNVVRNTNVTGIYMNADNVLRRGVVIASNVISRVGFSEEMFVNGVLVINPDEALAGGIFINGGGRGTIVSGNAIYDFRGEASGPCGAITINLNIAGASASVTGNTIDGSTAFGILVEGGSTGVRIAGNDISDVAYSDIVEAPTAGIDTYGGHHIENNICERTNTNHPSIKVAAAESTKTTFIRGIRLIGLNATDDPSYDFNSGIFIQGSMAKPVVVEGNLIRQFRKGIVNYGMISERYTTRRFERNHIQACFLAFVISALDSSACMVVEDNVLTGVTHFRSSTVCYAGKLENGRIVLQGENAAPSGGTWLVGDRAEFVTPTAGGGGNGNIGAVCVTAGNPGIWKTFGAIAV